MSLLWPRSILLKRPRVLRRLHRRLYWLLMSSLLHSHTIACTLDRPLPAIARRLALPHVWILYMWHRVRGSLWNLDLRVHVSLLRCSLRGRLLGWARWDDDPRMRLPWLRRGKVRLHWRRLRPVRHAVAIRREAVGLRRRHILAVRIGPVGLGRPVVPWIHGQLTALLADPRRRVFALSPA